MSWLPMLRPRRRARSTSVKSPSGFRQSVKGVGQPGQFVGAMLAGQSGQMGFGFLAGLGIDEIGQPVKEAADHRDMAGTDDPVSLRLGGGGQQRRQGFAVQSGAFA